MFISSQSVQEFDLKMCIFLCLEAILHQCFDKFFTLSSFHHVCLCAYPTYLDIGETGYILYHVKGALELDKNNIILSPPPQTFSLKS